MTRLVVFLVVGAMYAAPCLGQEEKAKVDKEIENLIAGRPANLTASEFRNRSEAALAIAKWIPELGLRARQPGQPGKVSLWALQGDLFARSLYFEKQAIREAKREDGHSTNAGLMDQYVELLCRDDICTGSFKNGIAQALNKFYPPRVLDKHAVEIEKALGLAKLPDGSIRPEVLLLYGSLPSIPDERVRAFVQTLPRPSISDEKMSLAGQFVSTNSRLFLDCVLARRGDKEAEQRVLEKFSNLKEVGGTLEISDRLVYIDTPPVRRTLAEGLRSNEAIPRIGGGTILKRTICANTLIKMMQDDPTFPVRAPAGVDYLDVQLDSIEKWCTERWKLSLPSTPRDKIRSEPHFFEMPEKTDPQPGNK